MTEKELAEDCKSVLNEAKSMGCNEIKALYNIPLKNMELIVQALKKQIPRKPVIYDDCEQFIIKCSGCGAITDTRIFHGFCSWCGQRLDFGE